MNTNHTQFWIPTPPHQSGILATSSFGHNHTHSGISTTSTQGYQPHPILNTHLVWDTSHTQCWEPTTPTQGYQPHPLRYTNHTRSGIPTTPTQEYQPHPLRDTNLSGHPLPLCCPLGTPWCHYLSSVAESGWLFQ